MTNKNVMKLLRQAVRYWHLAYDVDIETGKKLREMVVVVERAMKKQDPMKPDRLDGFRCRNCSGKLARQTDLVGQKYCHHCGQKLDWED